MAGGERGSGDEGAADARRSVILIVDDAVENITLLATALRQDYEVRFATSGEQAVAMASERPGPDLVLLDVVMPGMDGFTACQLLKEDERTRFIPVVIMTALDDIESRVRGIEAGADDFLTKPVDQRQLRARIRTALRAKHSLDEKLRALELQPTGVAAATPPSQVRACPLCGSVYTVEVESCALDGKMLALFAEEPLLGRRIDRYEVRHRIGQGAMSVVYLASHATLRSQRYALKVLYGQLAAQPSFAARFRREAEACAALEHPNVVAVLDFGTTPEGLTYMVMEHVPGRLLSDIIAREAPLPVERAGSIARQVAAGLAHAHARDLVHRDVKPSNVLVVAGEGGERVKILDFGIVGLLDEDRDAAARLTQQGSTVGTPLYMAPEQHRSPTVGPAADLYALGVTMYEMLAGRAPFSGGPSRLAVTKVGGAPPPLATTTGLEPLVTSLLASDPSQRPANGRAVIDAIDAVLRERGLPTPPLVTDAAPPVAPAAKETPRERPSAKRGSAPTAPTEAADPSRAPLALLLASAALFLTTLAAWLFRR